MSFNWIALMNGDPEKLIFPTDSYGNVCGRGIYEY